MRPTAKAKLGIIAGSGSLPRLIAVACAGTARPYHILAFSGHTDPETVTARPHDWSTLAALGKSIALLHAAEVKQLVFAGAIRRPSLASLKPDKHGAALLLRIGLRALGDDGLLRVITKELEKEGFLVIAVGDILSELQAPRGILTRISPDPVALADIARGSEILAALSAHDVGQAIVVQQGIVLGVEAIEGTDALLQRVANHRREGVGGVLVKLPKRGQDRRFDLPVIGTTTIANMIKAGLRGLAIEESGALLIDCEAVLAAADAAGIFVIAQPAS